MGATSAFWYGVVKATCIYSLACRRRVTVVGSGMLVKKTSATEGLPVAVSEARSISDDGDLVARAGPAFQRYKKPRKQKRVRHRILYWIAKPVPILARIGLLIAQDSKINRPGDAQYRAAGIKTSDGRTTIDVRFTSHRVILVAVSRRSPWELRRHQWRGGAAQVRVRLLIYKHALD